MGRDRGAPGGDEGVGAGGRERLSDRSRCASPTSPTSEIFSESSHPIRPMPLILPLPLPNKFCLSCEGIAMEHRGEPFPSIVHGFEPRGLAVAVPSAEASGDPGEEGEAGGGMGVLLARVLPSRDREMAASGARRSGLTTSVAGLGLPSRASTSCRVRLRRPSHGGEDDSRSHRRFSVFEARPSLLRAEDLLDAQRGDRDR